MSDKLTLPCSVAKGDEVTFSKGKSQDRNFLWVRTKQDNISLSMDSVTQLKKFLSEGTDTELIQLVQNVRDAEEAVKAAKQQLAEYLKL